MESAGVKRVGTLTLTREIACGPDVIVKTFAVDQNICADDIGGSGKDLSDTWMKMLLQEHMVTPPIVQAIINHYPTINQFRRALSRMKSARQAEQVLGELILERSLDPTKSQFRRLGPSLASKLWTMFYYSDPPMQFSFPEHSWLYCGRLKGNKHHFSDFKRREARRRKLDYNNAYNIFEKG
ncbi:hypothetical protein MIR68_001712 [Amoeboaphelidium protococcarum]|nr:hypothetical protein MIR68_001712 [Amoeboaphelidium protococcarum]